MKQMLGSDDEGKNSGSLSPNTQSSNPYGPPGQILPAGQPPAPAPYPPTQPYQGGGQPYLQPGGTPASLPAVFPAGYQPQVVGYDPDLAGSVNAHLPERSNSSSKRVPVALLIIGIFIATAYLGFLLLVLLKPEILALPAVSSLPVSAIGHAGQLLASSPIGLW